MDDENFYKDRILWKAAQNNLFAQACSKFDTVENDRQAYVLGKAALQGKPVLLFWSSDNLWTLLSSKEVVSQIDSSINAVLLDSINKNMKLQEVKSAERQATKLQSEILLIGDAEIKIWAPHGAEIFALMGILRMFPLGKRHNPNGITLN
ncbi:hypothetical protein [Propionivibrio sp.]|uniref:hypothetical protein n=1 Tax=Propionivibrio sp. TaxID=2212460 RepID=UPI00262D6F12|nr:hypothetical protein [Propionivibrio sp.]